MPAAVALTEPDGVDVPAAAVPEVVAAAELVAAALEVADADDEVAAALDAALPPPLCSSMSASQITRASATTIAPMASARRRQ